LLLDHINIKKQGFIFVLADLGVLVIRVC